LINQKKDHNEYIKDFTNIELKSIKAINLPECTKLFDNNFEMSSQNYLDVNSFSNNAFEEFPNLEKLRLKLINPIEFDFSHLNNLAELYLERKYTFMVNEKYLNIRLPIGLKKLKIIRFSINLMDLNYLRNLKSLEIIFPDTVGICKDNIKPFGSLTNLKYLKMSLYDCRIYDSQEIYFGPENLQNLEFCCLNSQDPLSNCKFSFGKNNKLKKLTLNSVYIDIDSLRNLENLDNLAINFSIFKENEIPELLKNIFKIKKLKCFSKINNTRKDFLKSFVNLQSLDLHDCELNNNNMPTLSNLSNLTFLNVSYNDFVILETSMFLGLTNLKVLKLCFNSISLVKVGTSLFKNMSKLKNLELIWLGLQEIDYNAFEGLCNLEYLNLCRNELREIKSGAFDVLKSLKRLNLGKLKF